MGFLAASACGACGQAAGLQQRRRRRKLAGKRPALLGPLHAEGPHSCRRCRRCSGCGGSGLLVVVKGLLLLLLLRVSPPACLPLGPQESAGVRLCRRGEAAPAGGQRRRSCRQLLPVALLVVLQAGQQAEVRLRLRRRLRRGRMRQRHGAPRPRAEHCGSRHLLLLLLLLHRLWVLLHGGAGCLQAERPHIFKPVASAHIGACRRDVHTQLPQAAARAQQAADAAGGASVLCAPGGRVTARGGGVE